MNQFDDDPQDRPKREDEIGALWKRTGHKGDYLAGSITLDGKTVKIVAFENKKTTERQPDFRVLKAKWQD